MFSIQKKKPRNGKLTDKQKEYNRTLSKERTTIENSIGAIKHFKRVSPIYNGSLEEFNQEFNIAAGLANLQHMFRNNTYNDWAKRLGLYTLDDDT